MYACMHRRRHTHKHWYTPMSGLNCLSSAEAEVCSLVASGVQADGMCHYPSPSLPQTRHVTLTQSTSVEHRGQAPSHRLGTDRGMGRSGGGQGERKRYGRRVLYRGLRQRKGRMREGRESGGGRERKRDERKERAKERDMNEGRGAELRHNVSFLYQRHLGGPCLGPSIHHTSVWALALSPDTKAHHCEYTDSAMHHWARGR